jgi:large subunit ribosomal protein L3
LGFAGYKVGMTHIIYTDAGKFSKTKGEDIFCPVTVLECPPIRVIGYQAYRKDAYGEKASSGGIFGATKELSRRILVKKKELKLDDSKLNDISEIRLVVQTQPSLTGFGKKMPEIFEIGIGGNDIKAKVDYAKSAIGKDIRLAEVFSSGQVVDTHAITKGKGTQGPVKRFGVPLRQHKAEKTKRGPATLGPWHPHHGNYRVAHAGKMGYHQRTQLNKWIVKISDDKGINPKGGWLGYGAIRTDYVFLKGSVDGPRKRLVMMTSPRRIMKNLQEQAPEIQFTSIRSKQ